MIQLKRTTNSNSDYIKLVSLLDADLAIRDGDDHSFYAQFNKSDNIKYVIVAYSKDKAVACGAIKEYESQVMEIKRMFTLPEFQGKGIASIVLKELEKWAYELNYTKCILETGVEQPEAIGLYKKSNYQIIDNYGQYANVATSICFKKEL